MVLCCSGTIRRPAPKRERKSDSSNSNNNSHHPHNHHPQLHRHLHPLEVPRRQRSIRGCDYSGDGYTLLVLAAQVMSVVWCIYTSCPCGTGDECGILSVGVSVSIVNLVVCFNDKAICCYSYHCAKSLNPVCYDTVQVISLGCSVGKLGPWIMSEMNSVNKKPNPCGSRGEWHEEYVFIHELLGTGPREGPVMWRDHSVCFKKKSIVWHARHSWCVSCEGV